MSAVRRSVLLILLVVFSSGASSKAPLRAEVVGACAPHALAAPGQGLFEVRYLKRGYEPEAIVIRGCGKNRAFRLVLPQRGADQVKVKVYALPFFGKGQFDFLLEMGWDDRVDYALMAAARGYDVVAEFATVQGVFFNDQDDDGRWEIQVAGVEEFSCANGSSWAKDAEEMPWVLLRADDLCPRKR